MNVLNFDIVLDLLTKAIKFRFKILIAKTFGGVT